MICGNGTTEGNVCIYAALHVINERKEVLNDEFGINDLIGSKEYCPMCDTFSPIVATTIPIHAREKFFNGKYCSLWRAKRNVGFRSNSHNTIIDCFGFFLIEIYFA